MVPLVEMANSHSSKASVLQTHFATCFLISDEVTSFCLQAMVLGNFQSRRAY